jgi:hypothetical protein
MGKRRSLNSALKWLDELLDEEEWHGDLLEVSLFQDFIAKLQPLAREFDELLKSHRKKMGRHAPPEARAKQDQYYRLCYEAVEQLLKDGKSVEDACALHGERSHQSEHTVRKIYYNWKRRLPSNQRKTRSRKRT